METEVLHTRRGDLRVRRATPDEVVDLRHVVLRAGLPRESAIFPGDEHPDALHVVACDTNGNIVGCATAHPSAWNDQPAWQVRGMATAPEFRSLGVGKAMLNQLERLLTQSSDVRQLWCNARVPAVPFYQRLGWHIASKVFEIPTAGPHVKMTRTIG